MISTELGGNGDLYLIHLTVSYGSLGGGTNISVAGVIIPHVLPILIAVSLLSPVKI